MNLKVMELLPKEMCLPDREAPKPLSGLHAVNGHSYLKPFPKDTASILFGLGCFWGAERLFWRLPGVYVTAVGYAGGETENPTYEEVCSGLTNHTEVVLVVYEPEKIALNELLGVFWQEHDPTQAMRQGNDRGTQYRSAVYTDAGEDLEAVRNSRAKYQKALSEAGYGEIQTEIASGKKLFYAEEYHQQYLHKVPNGYCGLAGTGVSCF